MDNIISERSIESSIPEDLFIDIFSETFGIGKVQYLMHEYPFLDIYGMGRYIDYAIHTPTTRYAIEIDGIYYHAKPDRFESDLLKQNSLVYKDWKVFRWTDRQLFVEPEKVKDELISFLGNEPQFHVADDYLPLQKAEIVQPRPHQEETLKYLAQLRDENITIALIPHATGSGKTITAILDAKTINLPTLYIAHTRNLVDQTYKKFRELWPEKRVRKFDSQQKDIESFVLVSTIQSIEKNLELFYPEQFGYIIIDEAHHAAAGTYLNLIKYFKPHFLLGLTGTDERHDGKSLIEIFQNNAPRLTLEEAIRIGELCPIRCVRVKTNVDLKNVRYNGINYNIKDLEQRLFIPERDELIVSTYQDHVPGKKAVVFCVSIKHAEFLAKLFTESGISARAISGRVNKTDRENTLHEFACGKIQVLCACDILNEGWDCPDIEVLMLARPTLSKVIYLQQLGRGTRKAPGKEALIVFDFVDTTTVFNQSLNLHRLLKIPRYIPGSLVAAPDNIMEQEQALIAKGEKPEILVHLHLWVKDFEAVDLFDWQDEIKNLLSSNQLSKELGISYETVNDWLKNQKIFPDYEVPVGSRTYPFFKRERVEEFRTKFNLPKRTRETLKSDFFDFIEKMDMTASYKPVLLSIMMKKTDERGKVHVHQLVKEFRDFYLNRKISGLTIEVPRSPMNRVDELSDLEIQQLIFRLPFEKFERKNFFRREKDLNIIGFSPDLWRSLNAVDKKKIEALAHQNIDNYYRRLIC